MATILIVDDEPAITTALGTAFQRSGGHVVLKAHTGGEGLEAFRRGAPDIVLLDLRLPDMTGFDVLERIREHHPVVIMITAYGDIPMAVKAMQMGAENFLMKPVELPHLEIVVERGLEKARLRRMSRFVAERRGVSSSRVLIGSSGAMRELVDQVSLLAASNKTTVLLLGESGTGKGRVAEMIHATSPRATRPFVPVNCAALTASSLDAELFGTQRLGLGGAIETQTGLLDLADGGTLFLDEIGDLDPHLQPKLLRVLEGKGFRRAGGTEEVTSDVRIIASTHKDLVREVTAGRFREDLYYRLTVMPVTLPPLRARARDDLVELIAHVKEELQPQVPDAPAAISDGALEQLLLYAWPGNVRELRNVLERSVLMARGAAEIEVRHLPSEVRGATGRDVDHHVPRTMAEVERMHIERTLRAHNTNRTHAAVELGISRATLIKKIKEYALTV